VQPSSSSSYSSPLFEFVKKIDSGSSVVKYIVPQLKNRTKVHILGTESLLVKNTMIFKTLRFKNPSNNLLNLLPFRSLRGSICTNTIQTVPLISAIINYGFYFTENIFFLLEIRCHISRSSIISKCSLIKTNINAQLRSSVTSQLSSKAREKK
jgi:hypothetical protein